MRTTLMALVLCMFIETTFAQADCERRAQRPAPVVGQVAQEAALQPLLQCVAAVDDLAACNRFVGKALERLFQNRDFRTAANEYLLANDIANGLAQPGNAGWTLIGPASQQGNLDQAQNQANGGRAVLAVKPRSAGPGHVALVLKGTLEPYPSGNPRWGALRPPNSASAFLNDPGRVFIGCPLSEVWQAPAGVLLYVK